MLTDGDAADRELVELRALYEPYVTALAGYLSLEVPARLGPARVGDDWRTSAWEAGASPPHPPFLDVPEDRG